VIADPVQRRRADDRVDAFVEAKVALDVRAHIGHARVVAEALAGDVEHPLRGVQGDGAPLRQALQQDCGHAARPATGVEDGLVSTQRQAVHRENSALGHRGADPVVAAGVPFAHAVEDDRSGPLCDSDQEVRCPSPLLSGATR
jgi:hypothetical protein